jgi:hypothetical protein
MDVKLKYLHDPDKNYMVRVCMLVKDALFHSPNSTIMQCEECGQDVWYDTAQVIPPHPEGIQIDGEVKLCLVCTSIHGMLDDEPMKWIGPESV